MRLPPAILALALPAQLLVFASTAGAPPRSGRAFWAYPSGVIVTSQIAGLARLGAGPQGDELTALARLGEPGFQACLGDRRSRVPLAPGMRVVLAMTARFATSGELISLEPETPPAPEMVECVARAVAFMQGAKLTPLKPPKAITVRITVEGVILSDDEAKGRGYLFYEQKVKEGAEPAATKSGAEAP